MVESIGILWKSLILKDKDEMFVFYFDSFVKLHHFNIKELSIKNLTKLLKLHLPDSLW